MRGDALASGQKSAQFSVAPGLKFDEEEMRRDLVLLPAKKFQEKYLIAQLEYDMLTHPESGEAVVNDWAIQMKRQAEFYQRGLDTDQQQADSLQRECFLTPFTSQGFIGKVIVDRDEPATPKGAKGRLLIPRSLRKEKTLLPTTGHVIKETIEPRVNPQTGNWEQLSLLGKRILFSPMSGTGICFKKYPVWIQLELSEIMAIVNREDVQIQEEELEPMV